MGIGLVTLLVSIRTAIAAIRLIRQVNKESLAAEQDDDDDDLEANVYYYSSNGGTRAGQRGGQ